MEFDQGIADAVCDEYAHRVSLSLQTILSRNPAYPSYSTFRKWCRRNAEFEKQYARASEDRAMLFAEEIIGIADAVKDETENAAVQAARLRVEARKWCASKLYPRAYGDRLETVNTSTLTVTDSRDSLRDKILSFDVDGAAHAPARLPH